MRRVGRVGPNRVKLRARDTLGTLHTLGRGGRAGLLGAALLLGLGGSAHAEGELRGRQLVYTASGGQAVWSRSFPASWGPLSGPLNVGPLVYLGVGPGVYVFDAQGRSRGRAELPGSVISLDAGARGGTVRVSTAGEGYVERFTLAPPVGDALSVQERVIFPPDPAVTEWLLRAAQGVAPERLARAAQQFPDNPFLTLRQAQQALRGRDDYAALSAVRRSLAGNHSFPVWTQLAARLDSAGFPAAANLALDRARRDAAVRGLDPALPVSRSALSAYGNPSGYVGTLLDQGRLNRAEVWMRFLRDVYPRFEGSAALYQRYAGILETQGRGGEAAEWSQFAQSLRPNTLYNLGPDDTRVVRDAARLATFALLLSLLAAFLTLAVRAARAQTEDLAPMGGRARSWRRPAQRARRLSLSYASVSERLALLFLSGALVLALGGWQWANLTGRALAAPALNMGTYGGGWYQARLDELKLRPGDATLLLSGLASQLAGDDTAARLTYQRAGGACALNNLGTIAQLRDDPAQARRLYQRALSLDPALTAASYNLGLNPPTPESAWQRALRPGEPRLCYPDRRALARATVGDLGTVLRAALTNPLGFLTGARPYTPLSWALLGSLLLLAGLFLLLLIPRAATAARLGRSGAFRLLATLLPGSGLLSSAWGAVLLVTWAAAAVTLLAQGGVVRFPTLTDPRLEALRGPAWGLLGATYILNLLGLLTAEATWSRQARQQAGGAPGGSRGGG